MAFDSLSDLFSLPGADDIKRWEEEHKKIEEAIRQLHEKRAYLERLIAVARGERPAPANVKRADGKMMPGSWMHEITKLVKSHPEGISYADLKNALPGMLGELLSKNPIHKAFYGALRRLERDEVIVRHQGHVFTPAGYKRYRDKVEKGEAFEVRGHDPRRSPMADKIKLFLSRQAPSKASVIRHFLASQPEFKDAMRNSSAVYNVLKRLVEREELVHDEVASTYALAEQEKAPGDISTRASSVEEAPTSSVDAPLLFRVVK